MLLVGPPGSGKSANLKRFAQESNIRVFDVRTQSLVERREANLSVTPDRRKALPPIVAGAGARSSLASGGTLPSMPVEPGTDHPDDRLSDPKTEPESWADRVDCSALRTAGCDRLAVDHLAYRIDAPQFRRQTLRFLEDVVYGCKLRLLAAADRDPLSFLDECVGGGDHASSERDQWIGVLQSFRYEDAGLGDEPLSTDRDMVRALAAKYHRTERDAVDAFVDESSAAPRLVTIGENILQRFAAAREPIGAEDVRREFAVAAEPYYCALWQTRSLDEKVVLSHLAEEGLVNPRSEPVVQRLLRAGLIVRDPQLRVMNETFRRFVVEAAPPAQLAEWEAGASLPWASIETAMVTVVIGLAGLLVLTQHQLVSAWTGFVPTLAPAVPTFMKFLASMQQAKKQALA
jgi:hypothetical protein